MPSKGLFMQNCFNISHKRTPTVLILILLSALIFQIGQAAPSSVNPSFIPHNFMRAGTWTALTDLKTSTDTIPSYNVVYSSSLINLAGGKMNAITSVSSFDCLASNEFSFNTTVSAITLSGFTVQLQILGNTYFNKIKFDYLGMTWVTGASITQLLYSDCFLASLLSVTSSTKMQPFTKQTILNTMTDPSAYKIQSYITGLKFLNNKDAFKKISVKSYLVSGTNYITQEIEITGNTLLEWACLGTVVLDKSVPYWYRGDISYKIGQFNLNRLTNDIDMTSFPTGYMPMYDQKDNKFFGLIEIEVYLGKPYQIIEFKSENPTAVEIGYDSLAAGGKMGYFFLALRQCLVAPHLIYSIVNDKCWDSCPDGTVFDTTACVACHFSCKTCTGTTDTTCSDCSSADNRNAPPVGGKCLCKTGFVENNVKVCPTCSSFMPNCLECDFTDNCLVCSGTFVFNTVTKQCECPTTPTSAVTKYLVPVSQVCASYPGCLQAKTFINPILCKTCDTANFFTLNTSNEQCVCQTNFYRSGAQCLDVCGDGINPFSNSTTYCDDGNSNNGDGCSSTCAVETGFGCFNPPLVNRAYCSPVKSFNIKYLYAQRVVNENAGIFVFEVSPIDYDLGEADFRYYCESSIPHETATGIYDTTTGLLKIKVVYLESIEEQSHTLKITLDPYKMSVLSASFSFKATGVNFDLTMDDNPQLNKILMYMLAGVCGLTVIVSLIFIFINYKIAGVELLLSSQVVYLGLLGVLGDNLTLYPLSGLKYLAGYNTIQMFQVNRNNYNVPFLVSSCTFAQFLLNFNVMAGLIVLVIFILIPLKINVWVRMYQRSRYTSPEMQQKLMQEEPTVSLKELSTNIKTAQLIADTYVDRVYFGFSLIAFMPLVVYFSIQLGFINKVGKYELSSFGNIMSSILLLMIDFCFFILVFQDTDKKLKMFNFGSKKLKSYPYRLMMFYFGLVCLFTIVLLSQFTFYVLLGMNVLVGIYVFVENPFDKCTFEYVDSVSKPILSLICLCAIKATSFFSKEIIFIPIIVMALLFISVVMSIVRVVRVKLNRAEIAKKILEDGEDEEADIDFEKNMKNTDDSEFNSQKSKKMNAKFAKDNGEKKGIISDSNEKDNNENGDNDDSGNELMKENQNQFHDGDEIGEDEDQLTRIKRSLRQDLKKRRGIVNKANEEIIGLKQKAKKSKKSKKDSEESEFKEHSK